MRTEELFKKHCLVLSELSTGALAEGVSIRPYVNGVVVNSYIFNGEVTLFFTGSNDELNSRNITNIKAELHGVLPDGMYQFLWHGDESTSSHSGVAKAKRILLGDEDASLYRLTPLKCTYGKHEGESLDWLVKLLPPELKQYLPFDTSPIESHGDFIKRRENIYREGYCSYVVTVGRYRYRLKRFYEEAFTIVGTLDSDRYAEVGGISISNGADVVSAPVKKGLSAEERRDIYQSMELYLGSRVVIVHEGYNSKGGLKGAKVRALRCRISY